jgi:hypothetical protein
MFRSVFVSIFILVMCLAPRPALAQGSGEINGIVTDPSGSAIVGAAVSVSEAATGVTRNALSNNSGLYSFPALSPATYNVSVDACGFQKQLRSNITIQVATGCASGLSTRDRQRRAGA